MEQTLAQKLREKLQAEKAGLLAKKAATKPAIPELKISTEETQSPVGAPAVSEEALLNQAREITFEPGYISVSLLQRRLRIGYSQAARLKDKLEAEREKAGLPPLRPLDVPLRPIESAPPVESDPNLRGSFDFIKNRQRSQAEILEGKNPYGLVFREVEAEVRQEIEGLSRVVSLPKDAELLDLLRGNQDRLSGRAELTIPPPGAPDEKAEAVARLRETVRRNEEIIADALRESREIEARLAQKRKTEIERERAELQGEYKRITRFIGAEKSEAWWKRTLKIVRFVTLIYGTLGGYLIYFAVKNGRISKRRRKLDNEEYILDGKISEADRLERERQGRENYWE